MRFGLSLFTFLLFWGFQQSFGQSLSANPESVLLQNNTSSGVVHWYSALTNLTSDTIRFRWYMEKDADWPSGWVTYLTDPGQNYNPVDGIDSSSFSMDTLWDPLDKFILQVDHKGIPAKSGVKFTLVNLDNLSDTVRIYFSVRITQVTETVEMEPPGQDEWTYLPGGCFRLAQPDTRKQILIFNSFGQLLLSLSSDQPVCRGNLPSGLYFFALQGENQSVGTVKQIFLP